jgi:hypothetical protein
VLPAVKDIEGDMTSMSFSLGSALDFSSYVNGKFIFTPALADVGVYTIYITLLDYNTMNPKSRDYSFTVTVLSKQITVEIPPPETTPTN